MGIKFSHAENILLDRELLSRYNKITNDSVHFPKGDPMPFHFQAAFRRPCRLLSLLCILSLLLPCFCGCIYGVSVSEDTETDTESPATEEVLMILPLFLIIAALVVLFVYVSKKKVHSKETNTYI